MEAKDYGPCHAISTGIPCGIGSCPSYCIPCTLRRRIQEHLRDHLTDGRWHDDCQWCLNRRRYGGDGMQATRVLGGESDV